MSTPTMSHNACYGSTSVAVPQILNTAQNNLGFTSTAYSDVTTVRYSFYEHSGLYWYSVTVNGGVCINSLFFVDLANCVRDFRSLSHTLSWALTDSSGLANFVARYNKVNPDRRS